MIEDNKLIGMQKARGFEKVKWAETIKDFQMPQRGTAKSAGYDIFYNGTEKIDLWPLGTSKPIPTGIKAYMRDDEVLTIHVRSSMGFKRNLQIANTTGIIDADYYNNPDNEGEIFIKLRNLDSKAVQTILPGERIAQGIFIKYLTTDDDNATETRTGGIGST